MKKTRGPALISACLLSACFVAISSCSDDEYSQEQIARGRYLTLTLSDCSACHTPPGGALLSGAEFIPGLVWASNLTPDMETGIGSWTDEQLKRAIVEGVGHWNSNPEGEPISPTMPYMLYGNMKDEDVDAIIAYLRTSVDPVSNELPLPDPMFLIPFTVPTLDYSSMPGDDSDPGKYLVAAAGTCIGCHTPPGADPSQLVDTSKWFAGGRQFFESNHIAWAQNLTPDAATGMGNWSDEDIAAAITNRFDPDPDNPNGLLCESMPSYSDLTDEDVAAMVSYFRSIPAISNPNPPCILQ